MLSHALSYATDKGWPVLPLKPHQKTPLTTHGLLDATTDPTIINDWWRRWPEANIGLRTGIVFDVLDIDSPEAFVDLARIAPDYAHTGPVSGTGKGYHYLFATTGAKNGTNLLPKVDFRGQNGYIVAPPSVHPLGHSYRWINNRGPANDLPDAPQWLIDLVNPHPLHHELRQMGRTLPNDSPIAIALSKLDLLDEFSQLGITFRRSANRLVGRCPFHADDTPSLHIYPNQTWYCFGCNEFGDALNVRHFIETGRLR